MKKIHYLSAIIILIGSALNAYSQQNENLLTKAKNFHNKYEFNKAIEIYNSILSNSSDSLDINIKKSLILSENGKNLLQFSRSPIFVKKENFKITDFFLKYPGMQQNSWVQTPDNLIKAAQKLQECTNNDSTNTPTLNNTTSSKYLSSNIFNYMYYPKGATQIVFSAPCKNGMWNIFYTEKINDTLWSAPTILSSNITTIGNEVFPLLSEDGKKIYFSSNGHYGMGGYDLYVSEWDDETKTWSIAQNIGFPFSSVADDFLFFNTPDKKLSLFASTRESLNDEIMIYAVEYESLPLKTSIPQDKAKLLSIFKEFDNNIETSTTEIQNMDSQQIEYNQISNELKELSNKLDEESDELSAKREMLNNISETNKQRLEQEILLKENHILDLQQKINKTATKLQSLEMDLISKGIIIYNSNNVSNETPIKSKINFNFIDNSIGITPSLIIKDPERTFNPNISFSNKAYIADLSFIPKELIYQIQIFSLSKKVKTENLKGASPVFERKNSNGRYSYALGVFYTYKEALTNLNTVKKKGFPSATIVAYNNGKQINIQTAKNIETKTKKEEIYNVTIEGLDILPKEALDIIKNNTTRDLAKTTLNGTSKFIIGPYTNKVEAEKLYNALKAANIDLVKIENIEKTK